MCVQLQQQAAERTIGLILQRGEGKELKHNNERNRKSLTSMKNSSWKGI